MKNELTEEIIENIKTLAAKLPRFVKINKKTGRIKTRQLAKGIKEPVFINHAANMQKDYITHGQKGIDNYVAEVVLLKGYHQTEFAATQTENKN